MSLFLHDSEFNLLPYDGIVQYHPSILSESSKNELFNALMATIPWKHDEVIIFGQRKVTARKVAWYGDKTYSYTYSGVQKKATVWTKDLKILKSLVELSSQNTFNSCLLNLYHDGNEGMSWHSDDEKTLGKNNIIASLSLGAERKFYFKHKVTKEKVTVVLEHGSLLLMKGETQAKWLHALPKTKKVHTPRINLTFRTIL